jgi:hypothetical protein
MERIELNWMGAYRGGRLLVDLAEAGVWDQLDAEVDRPFWLGGPAFGSKPFRGSVDRGSFYFRSKPPFFGRRNNATPVLKGTFYRGDGGTVIEYDVEPPVALFIVMPIFLLMPLGFGALVFFAMISGAGTVTPEQVLGAAACALLPVLFFVGVFSLSLWQLRSDARYLVRSLRSMFADVAIEQALPGRIQPGDERIQ